jgi:type VI secretion system protein ImpE
MTNARALVEAGRLADAVAALNEEVRSHPADGALRMFLFEVLCLQGDLARARKQLDVIATQVADPGIGLTVSIYQGLLAAESKRRAVFDGDGLPKFMQPPPPHVESHVLLLKKMQSAPDEAVALLEAAEEGAPEVRGERNGVRFEHFRDADDRVSAVLEVLHGEDYVWVPLSQVARLEIPPPKKLRELIWPHARLQLFNEPSADVFLTGLYPNSHQHANAQVAIARMTEWTAFHDAIVTGAGPRMFLVDDEEVPMLGLGTIVMDGPASGAETR